MCEDNDKSVFCVAGNWEGEGRFKMWFNHGGAIEFGQAMLHAGQLGKLTSWFNNTHSLIVAMFISIAFSRTPPRIQD